MLRRRRINIEDETLRRDIVVETRGSSRAHHQYELDELVLMFMARSRELQSTAEEVRAAWFHDSSTAVRRGPTET